MSDSISTRRGDPKMKAEVAVNRFLHGRLPDRFCAGEPTRDAGGGDWRVPVILSYPEIGPLGEVGEVKVSAETYEVTAHTGTDEMMERGRGLYEENRELIERPVE